MWKFPCALMPENSFPLIFLSPASSLDYHPANIQLFTQNSAQICHRSVTSSNLISATHLCLPSSHPLISLLISVSLLPRALESSRKWNHKEQSYKGFAKRFSKGAQMPLSDFSRWGIDTIRALHYDPQRRKLIVWGIFLSRAELQVFAADSVAANAAYTWCLLSASCITLAFVRLERSLTYRRSKWIENHCIIQQYHSLVWCVIPVCFGSRANVVGLVLLNIYYNFFLKIGRTEEGRLSALGD